MVSLSQRLVRLALGVVVLFILGFILSSLPMDMTAQQSYRPPTIPQHAPPTHVISMELDDIHNQTTTSLAGKRLLILTPLMNAAEQLDAYFTSVQTIDYPKHLISLGFLVSVRDSDPTLRRLTENVRALTRPGKQQQQKQPSNAAATTTDADDTTSDQYRRITILHERATASHSHKERHKYALQAARRQIMAKCRNTLVVTALQDEGWVLWLDVDVVGYAPTLVRELMALDTDVAAPNCFVRRRNWSLFGPKDEISPYDRNNWIETVESMAFQRGLDEDDVLFEGYEAEGHSTHRISMADLYPKEQGTVPLDGVGGTFLLVKAKVHRHGVLFPSTAVDHQLETEGFAKWAKKEGFQVMGVPSQLVFHE
ncbi:Golgi mannosyltransferase complex subunit [Actinomortierella ambigua]|nr:Golgi mannosyltransferase complex subunit [Actinomortierella ambigua]